MTRRLFGLFRRGPRPEDAAAARVKAWAAALLPEGTTVTASEIACRDPGCPGIETVILVMEPGRRTRAAKVQKAIDEVTEEDVRAALA